MVSFLQGTPSFYTGAACRVTSSTPFLIECRKECGFDCRQSGGRVVGLLAPAGIDGERPAGEPEVQDQVFLNIRYPSFSSTTISLSLWTFPSRIIFDNSFSRFFWITRLIGRAPNCGSKP